MSFQRYVPKDWQNYPSQSTPINRTNLYHAEKGIEAATNNTIELDSKKADLALVNTLVKNVTLDTQTGILNVVLQNGTSASYDLDIEKVVTNFDINDQNELVLILADGTQKVIDLTRFVYSVKNTATISMEILNRAIIAEIVDGSVTMRKLDAAIQTELRQYMLDAQSARDSSLEYSKIAKRYTIGDQEFEGSETDNAKYYYEQSKNNADISTTNAQATTAQAEIATQQANISSQKATQATLSANNASASELLAKGSSDKAKRSENITIEKANIATQKADIAIEKSIEAAGSALLSKRYSEGDDSYTGSETDNAKYYYQETKTLKEQVDAASKIVVPRFFIDFTTGKLMSDKAASGMRFWIENGKLYGEVTA